MALKPHSAPPRKPQPSPSPAAILAQRERLKANPQAERKAALAADSIQAGDGISARPDDDRAVSGATRLSQLVLPRIHALDLPLTPFPAVPLPGLERKTRNAPPPPRTRHPPKVIRAPHRAQYLLQAPQSLTPTVFHAMETFFAIFHAMEEYFPHRGKPIPLKCRERKPRNRRNPLVSGFQDRRRRARTHDPLIKSPSPHVHFF